MSHSLSHIIIFATDAVQVKEAKTSSVSNSRNKFSFNCFVSQLSLNVDGLDSLDDPTCDWSWLVQFFVVGEDATRDTTNVVPVLLDENPVPDLRPDVCEARHVAAHASVEHILDHHVTFETEFAKVRSDGRQGIEHLRALDDRLLPPLTFFFIGEHKSEIFVFDAESLPAANFEILLALHVLLSFDFKHILKMINERMIFEVVQVLELQI